MLVREARKPRRKYKADVFAALTDFLTAFDVDALATCNELCGASAHVW